MVLDSQLIYIKNLNLQIKNISFLFVYLTKQGHIIQKYNLTFSVPLMFENNSNMFWTYH